MKSFIAIALVSMMIAAPQTVMSQSVHISAFPQNLFSTEGLTALATEAAQNFAAVDSVAAAASLTKRQIPVEVTAEDFITKVYGVLSPDRSRDELCEDCVNVLNLMPTEDNMGLWLDAADGYQLNYYGQQIPDVSAMAVIERDSVDHFGFFFLFPYNLTTKEEMNKRQSQFCGSLLQEMQDIGVIMGVNPEADALFEAVGDYKGNYVDVRLMDETLGSNSGRYVLFLECYPGGVDNEENKNILAEIL